MDTTVISNGPRKSTVSRPPMPTEEELGKNFRKAMQQGIFSDKIIDNRLIYL